MRQFLASDVLYARAKEEIEETLGSGRPRRGGAHFELPARADRAVARRPRDRPSPVPGGGRDRRGRRRDPRHGALLGRRTARQHPAHDRTRSTPSHRCRPRSRSAVLNGGTSDETDVQVAVRDPRLDRAHRGRGDNRPDQPGLGGDPPIMPDQGRDPRRRRPDADRHRLPGPGETIIDNNESAYQVASAARLSPPCRSPLPSSGPAGTFSDDALRAVGRTRGPRRGAAAGRGRSTTR